MERILKTFSEFSLPCLPFESWTIWMGLVSVLGRRDCIWPKFSSARLLFSPQMRDNWQPCFVWNYGNHRLEERGVIISELKRCGCLRFPPKLPITGKEPVNWKGAEDRGTRQEHKYSAKETARKWFSMDCYLLPKRPKIKTTSKQFLRLRQRGSRYTSRWTVDSRWVKSSSKSRLDKGNTVGVITQRTLSLSALPSLSWVRVSMNIPRPQEGSLAGNQTGRKAKVGDTRVEKEGGGGGLWMSSRLADLDLKSWKGYACTRASHTASCPALRAHRTHTHTLTHAHTGTRTLLQAAPLATLQRQPLRGALAGGEAARPGTAPASSPPRSRGSRTRRAGNEACRRQRERGLPGADRRRGGGRSREGVTPTPSSRPPLPCVPSLPPPAPPAAPPRLGADVPRRRWRRVWVCARGWAWPWVARGNPRGPRARGSEAPAPPGASLQGAPRFGALGLGGSGGGAQPPGSRRGGAGRRTPTVAGFPRA